MGTYLIPELRPDFTEFSNERKNDFEARYTDPLKRESAQELSATPETRRHYGMLFKKELKDYVKHLQKTGQLDISDDQVEGVTKKLLDNIYQKEGVSGNVDIASFLNKEIKDRGLSIPEGEKERSAMLSNLVRSTFTKEKVDNSIKEIANKENINHNIRVSETRQQAPEATAHTTQSDTRHQSQPSQGTQYTNPTQGTPNPNTTSYQSNYQQAQGTQYTNPTQGTPNTNTTFFQSNYQQGQGVQYTNPTQGTPNTNTTFFQSNHQQGQGTQNLNVTFQQNINNILNQVSNITSNLSRQRGFENNTMAFQGTRKPDALDVLDKIDKLFKDILGINLLSPQKKAALNKRMQREAIKNQPAATQQRPGFTAKPINYNEFTIAFGGVNSQYQVIFANTNTNTLYTNKAKRQNQNQNNTNKNSHSRSMKRR